MSVVWARVCHSARRAEMFHAARRPSLRARYSNKSPCAAARPGRGSTPRHSVRADRGRDLLHALIPNGGRHTRRGERNSAPSCRRRHTRCSRRHPRPPPRATSRHRFPGTAQARLVGRMLGPRGGAVRGGHPHWATHRARHRPRAGLPRPLRPDLSALVNSDIRRGPVTWLGPRPRGFPLTQSRQSQVSSTYRHRGSETSRVRQEMRHPTWSDVTTMPAARERLISLNLRQAGFSQAVPRSASQ
ncbi:hypothetical protein ACNUDN_06176 [Mycobacterium sp. smrl_JER01]